MYDRLFENPVNPLFILGSWIAGGTWVVFSVWRMAEARLDVLSGLLAIVAAIVLAGTTLWQPEMSWLICSVMLMISFGVPAASSVLNRRDHALIDADVARKCIDALAYNASNAGARAKLANLCRQAELVAPAVAHLDYALKVAPQFFTTEKITLKSWQRDLDTGYYPRDLVCPRCRTSNEPDDLFCRRCGSSMLYLILAGAWLPQGVTFKLAKAWMIALAVGIAAPFSAALLPPVAALAVIPAVVALGLYAFWRCVR